MNRYYLSLVTQNDKIVGLSLLDIEKRLRYSGTKNIKDSVSTILIYDNKKVIPIDENSFNDLLKIDFQLVKDTSTSEFYQKYKLEEWNL